MRKNETESVREVFTKQFPVNLVIVDARDRFLTKLAGVSDPETKRKLIGGEFVYCFADEAKKLGGRGIPCAGHDLPGRDRIRLGQGQRGD